MRPLQTDLSILNKFNFENPPVGVKFLFNKPEGIEPLDKKLAICEMIREAQKRDTPFYMDKENEDCFGAVTLGMAETPAFAEAGLIGYELGIFKESRANSRIYNYLPHGKRAIRRKRGLAKISILRTSATPNPNSTWLATLRVTKRTVLPNT